MFTTIEEEPFLPLHLPEKTREDLERISACKRENEERRSAHERDKIAFALDRNRY